MKPYRIKTFLASFVMGGLLFGAVEMVSLGAQEDSEPEALIFPGRILLIDPPSRNEIFAAIPEAEVTLSAEELPPLEMPDLEDLAIPEAALEPLGSVYPQGSPGKNPLGIDFHFGGGTPLHILMGAGVYQYTGESRFFLDTQFESLAQYGPGKESYRQNFSVSGEMDHFSLAYVLDRRSLQGDFADRTARHLLTLGTRLDGEKVIPGGRRFWQVEAQGGWNGFFLEDDQGEASSYESGLWLDGGASFSAQGTAGTLGTDARVQLQGRWGGDLSRLALIPWQADFFWESPSWGGLVLEARAGSRGVISRSAWWPFFLSLGWQEESLWQVSAGAGYHAETQTPYGSTLGAPYVLNPEDYLTLRGWTAEIQGFRRVFGEVVLQTRQQLWLWDNRPFTEAVDGRPLWQWTQQAYPSDTPWQNRLTWESLFSAAWNQLDRWEAKGEWRALWGHSYWDEPAQSVELSLVRILLLPGNTRGGLELNSQWSHRTAEGWQLPVVNGGGWWRPREGVEVSFFLEDWLEPAIPEGRLYRNLYEEPGIRGTFMVQFTF